jgi:hypothetical protein
MSAPEVHEVRAVVHVHTTDSDGSASVPEICRIAASVGLDVVMFSDHMSLAAKRRGEEGYHHGVLAVIGYEHHDPRNKNHYLLFGIDEEIGIGLPVEEYFARAKDAGALGIAAHPDERRTAMRGYPPYPWTAWELPIEGLEVWNEMSEWMERLTPRNRFFRFVKPRSSLRGPTDRLLRKWDELATRRPVLGVGGVDAHAAPYRLGFVPLTIFPYKVQFQSVRTHLHLSEPLKLEAEAAVAQVLDALRSRRAMVVNRRRGDAFGFRFWAETPDGISCGIGDRLPFKPGTVLRVTSPRRADLALVGLGSSVVARETGRRLDHAPVRAGAYRVEAYRRGTGWVYTNHVTLL